MTLGDVCGKGPRAAVLAGQVRHSLRALLLLERDPEQLMHLINKALLSSYAAFPRDTGAGGDPSGDGMIDGGPPDPLLRADGVVDEVDARGTLLGAIKSGAITLRTATVELAPGDLLLYSDGITEAFGSPTSREMCGSARLKTALATCAGMPATAVVERLEQLSNDWLAGGVFDDRALLAIRRSR